MWGGSGQDLGRVRPAPALAAREVLPARPHPEGCLKQGQVTPRKGKRFHWCENPGEQKDSQTRNEANECSEIMSVFPLPASDSAVNPSFSLTDCAKPWRTYEPQVRIHHQQLLGARWYSASCVPLLSQLSQEKTDVLQSVSPPLDCGYPRPGARPYSS